MTEKEKAEELVGLFYDSCNLYTKSVLCAIVCVKELVKAFKQLSVNESGGVFIDFGHLYYEKVLLELEKM